MRNDPPQSVRLGEIVERFGGELIGSSDIEVEQVATLASAGGRNLAFLARGKYRQQLETTKAAAVIVGTRDRDATGLPRIVSDDPYLYFAKVSSFLNPMPRPEPGIHPQAVIESGAEISPTASIGPFCRIGRGASIGEHVVIGAGCDIGEEVSIGANTFLYPKVVVYHGCSIGRDSILHSGCVIGADGFGIAMDSDKWFKIPQIGRVLIGDAVEIGANTTIDRGALDDTVIEHGVKIDNQVQIAHNCTIGAHTAIAGCTGIAGSTRIGRYCKIGGNGMILGHLEITDSVDISAGTMITKSISEPGAYTAIFPFQTHREWMKNSAHLRHLDRLADRVRRIEKDLAATERKKT